MATGVYSDKLASEQQSPLKLANVNADRLSTPVIPGRWSARPLVIVASVVIVMYLAREVLIPLAFALVLSLIWSPPVNWLQKLHFHRAPAVLVVVVLGVAGDVGWIILNQLIAVVNELPNYQQNIHQKITIQTHAPLARQFPCKSSKSP